MRSERPPRSARRERAVKLAMPLDEAERIATNAAEGVFDLSDPDVARVVAQANRVVVRSQMWGTGVDLPGQRWRRLVVIGAVGFTVLWIVGLFLPLLAEL